MNTPTSETPVEAGLRLIKSSAPYRNAGGNLEAGWLRYKTNNPGEYGRLRAFLDECVKNAPLGTIPPRPAQDFLTAWAQGFALLGESGLPFKLAPPVEPLVVGAILVNAGSCPVEWLERLNVTHVCAEATAANFRELAFAEKWGQFTLGSFYVSRGLVAADKAALTEIIDVGLPPLQQPNAFTMVDTEVFKDDQFPGDGMDAQDQLFSWMDTFIDLDLYNITFARHQDATVVNHRSMKENNVEFVGEAYDEFGITEDLRFCTSKMQSQGWNRPHLCLGDKGITATVVSSLRSLLPELGGVWLWAPEQSGGEILRLEGVL